MESLNGVTCIKGEIHSLLTLMRLHTKWSSSMKNVRDLMNDEQGLAQSFRILIEYLEGTYDLREIDSVEYIRPFHEVVISEVANGALTSSALTSLSKFVLYGFLSAEYPRAQEGINLIAHTISHCTFEESDWESDEIILMKLLELSIMSMRSDASSLLTVGSAWDIYSTCLSIHAQYRSSKMLRSQAETALKHLTLTVFGRADKSLKSHSALPSENLIEMNDFGFNDAIRGDTWESASKKYVLCSAIGITLLLSKIMTILTTQMDLQVQKKEIVKNALTLINIALEAGGPSLGDLHPLVELLRGDVCRHLLRSSQSDDLEIFSLALRVVFNLFMSIKDHMKVQLEVFITSVHLRILQNSLTILPTATAKEELAMESLLEFCREPALMHDIYVNYDCDVQCTNLFDTIISTLAAKSIPGGHALFPTSSSPTPVTAVTTNSAKSKRSEVSSTGASGRSQGSSGGSSQQQMQIQSPVVVPPWTVLHKLALDGLLAILHSLAIRCCVNENSSVDPSINNTHTLPSSTDAALANRDISGLPLHEHQHMSSHGHGSGSLSIPGSSAQPLLDQQVDRWCDLEPPYDMGSELPSPVILATKHNIKNDLSGKNDVTSSPGPSLESIGKFNGYNGHSGSVGPSVGVGAGLSDGSEGLKLKRSASVTSNQTSTTESMSLDEDAGEGGKDSSDNSENFVRLARQRTAEVLRQRKQRKHNMKVVAELFNANPLSGNWIRRAADLGLLPKPLPSAVEGKGGAGLVDSHHIARFLKNCPGLAKGQIGEFISKGPPEVYPYHAAVLRDYVDSFDFTGEDSTFDGALRKFLGHFRLPGEAQCIDRIMEAFSKRLFQQIGPHRPFASADSAFVLSFSTIMLNTDLHNPQIQDAKRMKKEEFVRNNRGINDGKDLPREFLEALYDRIQAKQIQVDTDLNDPTQQSPNDFFNDTVSWDALLKRGAAGQAPASFTPTVTARRVWVHSRQFAILGSNEMDMFLTMANTVLSVLLGKYWEQQETDDQIFGRLFCGLDEYASVCTQLNLNHHLNRLIQLMCERIIALMMVPVVAGVHSSSKFEDNDGASNGLTDRMKHAAVLISIPQWDSLLDKQVTILTNSSQDLSGVLADSSQFFLSNGKKGGKWLGAGDVRAALMIRSLLHITWKYVGVLYGNTWSCILRVLLSAQELRSLPDTMVEIDDFTDARGAPLPPSSLAILTRQRTGENTNLIQNESHHEGSIWNSVTSLGGLLWSNNIEKNNNNNSSTNHRNSSLMESRNRLSQDPPNKQHSVILRVALESAKSDQLLFGRLKSLSDEGIRIVIRCLLQNISGKIMTNLGPQCDQRLQHINTEISINIDANQSNSSAGSVSDADTDKASNISTESVTEINAVIVLEWISRIMFANRHRVEVVWPLVHEFLQLMILSSKDLDLRSLPCPYLLERGVVTILRAAIHVLDCSVPGLPKRRSADNLNPSIILDNPFSGEKDSSKPMEDINSVQDCMWKSLNLLTTLSQDITDSISDRLGAGLLALLRGGPKIKREEHWNLLFNLLDGVVRVSSGRIFVWEALGHLVDSNNISSLNFRRCRRMALNFLYQSFGVDDCERLVEELISTETSTLKNISISNIWLTGTLIYLLKMTLMVLAGYQHFNSSHRFEKLKSQLASGSTTKTSFESPMHHTDLPLAVFYLPSLVHDISPASTSLGSNKNHNAPLSAPHNDDQHAMTVSPIILISKELYDGEYDTNYVKNSCEINTIQHWLQTIAVFAELSGADVAEVARHSTFCLRTILLAGSTAELPDLCWAEAVQLLLFRLPLQGPSSTSTTSIFLGSNAVKVSNAEHLQILQTSLRSCTIVFEVFVAHYRILRVLPDFQTNWLKFLTTLGTNANGSPRGSPLHDELIDMIAALIRLLQGSDAAPLSGSFASHQSNGLSFGGLLSAWSKQPTPSQPIPVHNSQLANNLHQGFNVTTRQPEVDDTTMLRLSWRALSAVYPALPALLRARFPQIHTAAVRGNLLGPTTVEQNKNSWPIIESPQRSTPIPSGDPEATKNAVQQQQDQGTADVGRKLQVANISRVESEPNGREVIMASKGSTTSTAPAPVRPANMRRIDARTQIV